MRLQKVISQTSKNLKILMQTNMETTPSAINPKTSKLPPNTHQLKVKSHSNSKFLYPTKTHIPLNPILDPYNYSAPPNASSFSPYSQNLTSAPPDYTLSNPAYQNVQKHASSGGVPVMTSALTAKQRRALQRQIISLYPDILNQPEAEKVKACGLFSQFSGLALL